MTIVLIVKRQINDAYIYELETIRINSLVTNAKIKRASND